ncbi:MAG: Twin arginine targeting translocation protein TatC subunit [Parcubacteria group bacterium]|nr:Twin arginine targeting translocation protein TatC subunit [Parcubacteria group bacterium]
MERKNDDARSIWEHLLELRTYFFIALGAFIVGACATHFFHVQVIELLFAPLGTQTLVFLSPLDPLLFIFKIDFFGGFLLALPIILFCLFRFIAPAFGKRSTTFIAWFLVLSAVLAVAATVYTYLLLLPLSVHFLLSIHVPGVVNFFTAEQYINFVLMELVLMALIFQIPSVVVILAFARILDPKILAKKRAVSYITAIIVLSILTPTTDLFSLSLFLVPTLIIFEISILLGRVVYSLGNKG